MGANSSCDCFGAGATSRDSMRKSGLNPRVELAKPNPHETVTKPQKYQAFANDTESLDTTSSRTPRTPNFLPGALRPKTKGQRKLELADFIMLRV